MANELMSMPLDEAIPLTRACGESSCHSLKLLYIPLGQAVLQLRRRPPFLCRHGVWHAGHYLNLTQIAETHHR